MVNALIKMNRVTYSVHIYDIGDFNWDECDGIKYILIAIPSPDYEGDDENFVKVTLAVVKGNSIEPKEIHQDRIWGWNGDEDQPTLTPSIHCIGHWHGWVRDGFLVEA